jgi:K+-transporting ATPase ATPase A chain
MNGMLQMGLYVVALLLLAWPLGRFMAQVYEGRPVFLSPALGGLERLTYRLLGIDPAHEMNWKEYFAAVLAFSAVGFAVVFALQLLQGFLPLNPENLGPVPPDLAFNTAASFATNTNWQAYGGETTLSYFTQMVGLTAQNYLSAATGMAVLVALIRGFRRSDSGGVGNFWVDVTRATLYVLVPLSLVLALVLVGQGVVQTFDPYASAHLLEPTSTADGATVTLQRIALGPAASQIAIKQLGTNGGGFFNGNSAHPFENPTPLAGWLELSAILLIPIALCFTFGAMIKDRRQGWALLAAMLAIFVPLTILCIAAEQAGTPLLSGLGVDQTVSALQSGGNMEGKEVRFGITGSAMWATATTAASNGSVNAMHDSFTPLGGLAPLWLILLGEVVFGGVGSGLYGMLVFAVIAVFIAGLMVGRTPEYLGKKLEAREMKLASLAILVPVAAVLGGTAVACVVEPGTAPLGNPGAHGFSEILYAFASASNNNGSAFAGLGASGTFYATGLGLCMLAGRYWIIVPVLAMAGSLARKKLVPPSQGTLGTHTPLFVALLSATVLLVGAVTYVPALALGPIVEHLSQPAPSHRGQP